MQNYERVSLEEMDGEIFYNFPVEIRKPRSLRKTSGDRLHFAVWKSEEDQVRDLVVHKGVPVDSFNSLGQTPLFVAACMSKSDIVTQLLHLGANPNARCRGGHTPVHAACFSGSRRILSNILKFGGDLTIHDSNRKIPADWIDFQSDERRRHRAHTVLESFRLNEIRNLKLIENNQNVPYSNYDDKNVQYLDSQVGHKRRSKKCSPNRSFDFPTRVLSQEEKHKAKALTDKFLHRYEESGGRPILSYELNADKDLSDSDALSLLDYQSDGSSQSEEYALGGSLQLGGLDEPDHMSKRGVEKLKRSCSFQEGTSEVSNRQLFGIAGHSRGIKESIFQRASVSSLPARETCKPVTHAKNLKFFLSKKDEFEFESVKEVETKGAQAKVSNLRVQVVDRGLLNTVKKADVTRAPLPLKLRFNTTIPTAPRVPNKNVFTKNTSAVATSGSAIRPIPLKQIISPNKSNVPGLQGILGRRIRSNPDENHLAPAISNQPVLSKVVSQSVKQSPPSGLVFSAERYAAHKQTSTLGASFSTEQREVKVLKNAPSLLSSTDPEKQNKACFSQVNPQTGRNIASDIEFRVILENMKRRSTTPHVRKQKGGLEPTFPDVVCGTRRSEPRPTIKPASHFTESHGQVPRPMLQEEGARACPKKVVVMDNTVQAPSRRSKVQPQYLESKSKDFNFGATRAIFESSKVNLPNFAPLMNGPRKFRSRINPKNNILKPVARKVPPPPPPKPNLVYKESVPPFDSDFDYAPPAFQTSTPRRPTSVEQKANLYAPVTGLNFSRVTTKPSKSFKPYNSEPAEVTYNDLGSSIDYHTANSSSVIGDDFDISALPTPQPSPPPLPLFKVPYEARIENHLVSKGPLTSGLMLRSRRVDPAPVVDISNSLAIGGEVHFDTILERTMMLERSAKIRQTIDQTCSTDPWLTFDGQDQNIENNKSEGDGPDDSEEGSWSFPQPPLNEEIEALENGQLADYSWSQDRVAEGDDRRDDDYSPYTTEGFCEEQNNLGDDEKAGLDEGQTWGNNEPEIENECYEENQNGDNREVNDDAIPNSWGEDGDQFEEEPVNESRINDCHGDGIQEEDEVQNDDKLSGENNPELEDDQSPKCDLNLDPRESHWKTLDVDSDCPHNDGTSSKNQQNPTDDQYFDDHLEEDCVNEPHLNLLGDTSFGFDGSSPWN